jgi:hypothetical protein
VAHPEKLTEAGDWFSQLPPETPRFVIYRIELNRPDSNQKESRAKLREIWKLPDAE